MSQTKKQQTLSEKSSKFEMFARVATVFGFINDTIGLATVIYSTVILMSTLFVTSTRDSEIDFIFTSIPIKPWYLLPLWTIAFYVYLILLRKEWDDNRNSKRYDSNFWKFILKDVFFGFRTPLLSILGAMFAITIVWIYVEILMISPGVQLVSGVIGTIILIIAFATYLATSTEQESKQKREIETQNRILQNTLDSVENNWSAWETRIQNELKDSWYVVESSLDDMTITYNIHPDYTTIILTKYASLHPKQVKYVYVYDKESNEPYFFVNRADKKIPTKVLVSLRKFPSDAYLYSPIVIEKDEI